MKLISIAPSNPGNFKNPSFTHMTSPRIFVLPLLLTLLTYHAARSQGIARHSFAFSLESGPASLRHSDRNTGQVGAGINYQYKFAKFFALRTSMAYRYITPLRSSEIYDHIIVGEKVYTHSERSFGYSHFAVQVSPCLYWRQESFALIAGLAGGMGNLSQNLHIEDFYYTPAIGGQSSSDVTKSRETALAFGYGPMLGISLPTAGGSALGEVEVSVFYQRWDTPKNLRLGRAARTPSFSYDTYGLQAAYRVNF